MAGGAAAGIHGEEAVIEYKPVIKWVYPTTIEDVFLSLRGLS